MKKITLLGAMSFLLCTSCTSSTMLEIGKRHVMQYQNGKNFIHFGVIYNSKIDNKVELQIDGINNALDVGFCIYSLEEIKDVYLDEVQLEKAQMVYFGMFNSYAYKISGDSNIANVTIEFESNEFTTLTIEERELVEHDPDAYSNPKKYQSIIVRTENK